MKFNHEMRIMKDCPNAVLMGIDLMSKIDKMATDLVSGILIPIKQNQNERYAHDDVFVLHQINA